MEYLVLVIGFVVVAAIAFALGAVYDRIVVQKADAAWQKVKDKVE